MTATIVVHLLSISRSKSSYFYDLRLTRYEKGKVTKLDEDIKAKISSQQPI